MSIQIHTPVPKQFRENLRERAFKRLYVEALNRALAEKEKMLPASECAHLTNDECSVIEKRLREELEKRGFFDLT